MKIQCDVCGKEAASVFCTADEAALCQNCDNRVHNANKLASKHPRFSLLNPQLKQSPRCDICQERQALLFCQEDRALLCRDCDIPIHKANELTKKHNRFLLTGVKLSAAVSSYQGATSSSGSHSATEMKTSVGNANCSETSSNPTRENKSTLPTGEQASDSTSSISEYLMETLPGWHVEDLLDPSSHYGYCKIDEQVSSLSDDEPGSTTGFFIKGMLLCLLLIPAQVQNKNEVERIWDKYDFSVPSQVSISQDIEAIFEDNDGRKTSTSYSVSILIFSPSHPLVPLCQVT